MGRTSNRSLSNEHCWVLVGHRQCSLWHARRMHRTVGDPASVALDAAWVTEREESKGDVVGFYHTHPSGAPTPSRRDDKTMRARVSSFGKPLACLIEADFQVNAFLYEQGKARGRKLTACDLFPRGAVVMFDPFNKE